MFAYKITHQPPRHRSREDREDLAFAYNAGANVKIRPRAVEETDPDVLETHGEGYYFPLHPMYSPLAGKYTSDADDIFQECT